MAEKKYTKEAMLKALEAVERGASTSSAAKEYNVPRTTLLDKLKGRSSIDCSKGPPTILTAQEEVYLENWIIFMADSGFPVTKEQLRDSVSILIKKLDRKNPFINNKPGRHWFEAFIKRHPKVRQRVSQNLTQTRAQVTEEDIRKWFREVKEYFVVAQLDEASQDPRRIFNCDESAFFLSPTSDRVLAKRGSKNVYNITPSGDRECVTVLITANAAGQLAPPMVLFRLKSIPSKISKQAPGDWGLGHTAKGWMTGESFYEYITNVFFPWIERSSIPLPIIFFLDGHCSHTTLPLSNFCRQKNIILIALFPNATHLLQPMDVSVFRPLKRIWKKTVYEWRNNNQFVKMKKEHFCPLLEIALKQLDPNTITNGFRKSGLSPFDADSVDFSKCVTSKQSLKTTDDNLQKDTDKNAHFKFFESQISPLKLKAFYENKASTWQGSQSLEGLFTLWRKMKTQLTDSPDSCEDIALLTTDDQIGTRQSTHTPPEQALFEIPNPRDHQEALKTPLITILQSTEPVMTGEDQISVGFGNFTGLSDILDSNRSLDDISAFNLSSDMKYENDEVTDGKVELFEVINGELIQIIPDRKNISSIKPSIPIVHDKSLPLFATPKKSVRKLSSISTGLVIRATGSQPIHLTPRNELSKKFGMTPSVTSSSSSTIITVEDAASQTFVEMGSTPLQIEAAQPRISEEKQYDDDKRRKQPNQYYGDLVVPTPFKDALFWPEAPSCKNIKQKVKIPSVITSDRWQIFAQKKNADRIDKEKRKDEAKERKKSKSAKLCTGGQKKRATGMNKATDIRELKDTKKSIETRKVIEKSTGTHGVSEKDWYCRLCQTCVKLDMIQCLSCKVWYHTSCAEVQPTEMSYYCLYCNV